VSPRPGPDATPPGADRPTSEPARPVAAATVVLLRPALDGFEVLLTRRPATMAFGPDIHVFPGGRVDAADADPAALAAAGISEAAAAASLGLGLAPDGGMTPSGALAHHVAAVRETAEETGIAIEAAALISLTRWVTPISLVRRFDVRFFAAFVPPGTGVGGGSDEVAEATWLRPDGALAAARRAEMEIWQPTFVTLQQLGALDPHAGPADVRAAFAVGDASGGPAIERRSPDLVRVDAAWAAGIPGRRAAGWLVGAREVVVVDPADPTGVTSDAIRSEVAAAGGRLAGVVVTSLAPERHAGVEMLAHGLGLPVAAAAGTVDWAPYPVVDVAPREALPFGDRGLTLEGIRSLPLR
jgi:8-oxo-dGTP pyrophosphatase MutT (NUDIX family)